MIDRWKQAGVWIQGRIEGKMNGRRQVLTALLAVCLMIVLRAAIQPIIGSDISFTVFFPVVIIATLTGGIIGGLTTICFGSLVALAFSTQSHAHGFLDAAPRLIVWLISSSVATAVSLRLRHTMLELKRREGDLNAATEQLQIVVGELEHRGKNALAIVEALSHEAARNAGSVDEYKAALSSRIKALAAGYAFLTRRTPAPVLLGSMVGEILSFFEGRIEMSGGPMVWLTPNVCVAFSLVLHELATNAAKYGALSTVRGRVTVSWQIINANRLSLAWVERDGPVLGPSPPRGFGSRMIQRAFGQIPGGAITSELHPDGFVCRLDLDYGPHGPSCPGEESGARIAEEPWRMILDEKF